MEQIETEEQHFERLVQFIRRALFQYEIELLEKVEFIFNMSLKEILLSGIPFFTADPPIIKSADIPELLNKTGLYAKIANLNEEEKNIIKEFSLTVALKIPKIIEEFFAETINNKNALEFAKNDLQNSEILYERLEEVLENDKFEKYLVKRKRQVEILDKTVKSERVKKTKLIWNEIYDLYKFSNELKEKDVIGSSLDFINIFTNQNICTLKKENIDFIVVLMYELIDKKPSVILTESNSSRGVLTILDTFFRDETAIITKTISFTKRLNRIKRNDLKYDKIKDKVDLFLKNHLHKV